eukprot:scaffold435_cov342-Pavlova_lutheri.AAC.6
MLNGRPFGLGYPHFDGELAAYSAQIGHQYQGCEEVLALNATHDYDASTAKLRFDLLEWGSEFQKLLPVLSPFL